MSKVLEMSAVFSVCELYERDNASNRKAVQQWWMYYMFILVMECVCAPGCVSVGMLSHRYIGCVACNWLNSNGAHGHWLIHMLGPILYVSPPTRLPIPSEHIVFMHERQFRNHTHTRFAHIRYSHSYAALTHGAWSKDHATIDLSWHWLVVVSFSVSSFIFDMFYVGFHTDYPRMSSGLFD